MSLLGIIGEKLSWIGAIIGTPILIAALILANIDDLRTPAKATIVEDLDQQRVEI